MVITVVVSPNGGESSVSGSTHKITWSSAGDMGVNVRIALYYGPTSNFHFHNYQKTSWMYVVTNF